MTMPPPPVSLVTWLLSARSHPELKKLPGRNASQTRVHDPANHEPPTPGSSPYDGKERTR
jgi:hypothetical protein